MTDIKERPILFSAPMVLALLSGAKTQTRRIVKPQPVERGAIAQKAASWASFDESTLKTTWCPYGKPGDRLWVRETWGLSRLWDESPAEEVRRLAAYRAHVRYAADGKFSGKSRPSIHMPRVASRITLEVTSVRIERLQWISPSDAIAEGLTKSPIIDAWRWSGPNSCGGATDPRDAFEMLWMSINGADSWKANPWVWVIEFKRIEAAHG